MKLMNIKAEMFRRLVRRYGEIKLCLFGNSMSPELANRELVMVKPPSDMQPGNIYLFINPNSGRLACHRLIGIKDGICVMKGDNEDYVLNVSADLIIGEQSKLEDRTFLQDGTVERVQFEKEWLFDDCGGGSYWLWHVWNGQELISDLDGVKRLVGDYKKHPCSIPAASLELQIDRCEYYNCLGLILTAFYDEEEALLRFRCLKDMDLSELRRSDIFVLLSRPAERHNFRCRQMQYLGLLDSRGGI